MNKIPCKYPVNCIATFYIIKSQLGYIWLNFVNGNIFISYTIIYYLSSYKLSLKSLIILEKFPKNFLQWLNEIILDEFGKRNLKLYGYEYFIYLSKNINFFVIFLFNLNK